MNHPPLPTATSTLRDEQITTAERIHGNYYLSPIRIITSWQMYACLKSHVVDPPALAAAATPTKVMLIIMMHTTMMTKLSCHRQRRL
jgi:creatinine amidohydrolase/Fe(II)-dependent formamide hydrolase-like protein